MANMSDISTQATTAREQHRKKKGDAGGGQFGEHPHQAPDIEVAEANTRERALNQLADILADYPHLLEPARTYINDRPGDTWQPQLVNITFTDELTEVEVDALLTGDEAPLDNLEESYRSVTHTWGNVQDYAHDLLGCNLEDLDTEAEQELSAWIQEYDRSTPVAGMLKITGDKLIQLPATGDDEAFGRAISDASTTDDEEARAAAIEKVFADELATSGIEMTEKNRDVVRQIIAENNLDFGWQHPDQWQMRLVTYTDPGPLAMSSYGPHKDTPRDVNVRNPYLLVINPFSGCSWHEQLEGEYRTSINMVRPARLDVARGYGSLDKFAGVDYPLFGQDVTVTL